MLTEEERRRNKALAPANPQIARTQQMLAQAPVPPPAAKLAVRPEGLPQRNPQLAATSGVAAAVPPAAPKFTAAPPVRRFNSGIPGVQGPAMPATAQATRAPVSAPPVGVVAVPQQPMAGGGGVGGVPQRQLVGTASGQAGAMPSLATPPQAPAVQPTVVPTVIGDGKTGRANAAAPGQVALSEKTQQPLPGKPLVGADGSVQYNDAWQRANQGLVKDYESRNVVPTVVPGAGVAGGMLAQTPQVGQMRRAQGGFTNEDRLQQLDGLDRLGAQYRRSQADDKIKMASLQSRGGNFRTAAAQLAAAGALGQIANDMTTNPRVGQLQRSNPDAAAANAIDQQRLQQDAAMQAQQIAGMQVDTAGKQLSLKQQQQMAALTEMLTGGDEKQRAKAVAVIAALTGGKQGQPIKLKQQFDTGQKAAMGTPIMGEKEILVDWNGNRLDQDAGAQGGAQRIAVGPDGKRYAVGPDGSMTPVGAP